MAEPQLNSDGFRVLQQQLDDRLTGVEQNVIDFRRRVEGFEQLGPYGRARLCNDLRLLAGLRRRRLPPCPLQNPCTIPSEAGAGPAGGRGPGGPPARTADVDHLLRAPQQAADLQRRRLERECVRSVGEKAGRLTVLAYEAGILRAPPALWTALATADKLATKPGSACELWESTVLPFLKREYEPEFRHGSDVADLRVACEIMAGLVRGSTRRVARRPRGRPPVAAGPHDKKIVQMWQSGDYRTYADLARELGLPEVTEDYVRKLFDRQGKKQRRKSSE